MRLWHSFFFLASCAKAPDPWILDAIATGDPQYDSSRLLYHSPLSHLKLEFLRAGDTTSAYLFLEQFRFTPTSPSSHETEVSFTIGETLFKESLYLREGQMRLKLPSELKERLIVGLQEGKQIAIVANGIQETVHPGTFKTAFAKFLKGDKPLNFIRGPFE